MNLPNWNGWQLSRESVPAVVARTCALPRTLVSVYGVYRRCTHKTKGDLIFSASRVRLMLFHAYANGSGTVKLA